MSYSEQDYLLLSGLQHFEFCKRQWALIHIEQQWADNYQTALGEIMHKRAHDETSVEKREKLIIMRGIRVFSSELGLSGQCDVVEFHREKVGIPLPQYEGLWSVLPIEYKKGTAKEGLEDKVQLCAQAICLEEMFLTEIPKGFLFYGENKRRTEVCFTPELREYVRKLSKEMHHLYERTHTPKVKTGTKCRACSLKDICIPKLNKKTSVENYIQGSIHGDDFI